MSFKVLLLEDDHFQRRYIRTAILNKFQAEVEVKSTESEFVRDFEQIAENPPDVAVLDGMVRWANLASDQLSVPESAKHPETAGIRCAQKLKDDPRTTNVKIILYSVLNHEEVPPNGTMPEGVISIVKEADLEGLLGRMTELHSQPA